MRFPEPQRTEVDGIPVWFTDVPGPCLAGLVFRVGRCDETLPISGVTHLVEHLALTPLASARVDMNGSVGLFTTTFQIAGTQEEAEWFLQEICTHLSALPVDRLDLERRILKTEALRSGGSLGGSLSARFRRGSERVRSGSRTGTRWGWAGSRRIACWNGAERGSRPRRSRSG